MWPNVSELQLEQEIQRWEDQRELKNMMGKYVLTMLLEERDQAFDRFWSGKEDVCLGVNEGWYAGAEAIRGFYDAQAKRTQAESELMCQLFPEKLGKLTAQEQYGVGHLDNRPVSAPVIAVAEDGQTAKGMWTSMGCYTAFDVEYGPQSHWNWSVYAVDFVREDDGWKIWHMQYLTEIDTLCGSDWSKPAKPAKSRPEFAKLAEAAVPGPNHPARLHTPWSEKRLKAELPHLPQAYRTFADTFSYGM
jgi:hypothetical protein